MGSIMKTIIFPDDPSFSSVPTVTIDQPQTLTTVGASPVTVVGTLDDPDAQLTVNGIPVGHVGGQFQVDVALEEGANTIIARAVDANNHAGTATISISLDKTPPYVTIDLLNLVRLFIMKASLSVGWSMT